MGHKTQEELVAELNAALEVVKVGDKYSHFKHPHQYYLIEFVGLLEASEEVCVGYRAQYGEKLLWVRTLTDFLGEKEVEGKMVKKFVRI